MNTEQYLAVVRGLVRHVASLQDTIDQMNAERQEAQASCPSARLEAWREADPVNRCYRIQSRE